MDFKKNYYRILELDKTATKEEIKTARRRLAMKYHPDRNPGDPGAEDKLKDINEAYEVLFNDISRSIYDEYRIHEEKLKQQAAKGDNGQSADARGTGTTKNRRTYERKTVIRNERKIYVKGGITVKYWAEQESDAHLSILHEILFKINPTSAEARIVDSDIHAFTPPLHFQKAYSEADIFRTPLPQPIKCRIVVGDKEELYDLFIHDLRIINPVLTDITKYERQSLGTLKGEFYGYVLRVDEEEITELVSECFGETGNVERKVEDGETYFRKEYYHSDCTTYWGPWAKERATVHRGTSTAGRKPTGSKTMADFIATEGCAQWWWLPVLFAGVLIWPKFFLGLLLLALLFAIFSVGVLVVARLIPFLGLLLLGYAIYAAFRPASRESRVVKREWKPAYDTLTTKREPVDTNTGSNSDTLISHFIRWRDYDSIAYAVSLEVLAHDVRTSAFEHNQAQLPVFANSLAPIYSQLGRRDDAKLQRVYSAFDSIRRVNGLNELAFAKMVVSCIQAIPYYLVLDQSCEADYSYDEFISRYLRECNRDCCIGGARFGVRSPVEFFSDLKGDCDTRSLVLYTILKKFNYRVALLTSEYYKHAIIAVGFDNEREVAGLAMNINNRNYYLWETTDVGFQPGQVPAANRNLSYWDIALLNENISQ